MSEAAVAQQMARGPDLAHRVAAIQRYVDTGYDHVAVRQVGPDRRGFRRFYGSEVLPRLQQTVGTRGSGPYAWSPAVTACSGCVGASGWV